MLESVRQALEPKALVALADAVAATFAVEFLAQNLESAVALLRAKRVPVGATNRQGKWGGPQHTLWQVADELRAGDKERVVVRRIRKAFHRQGVHRYFHVPVALASVQPSALNGQPPARGRFPGIAAGAAGQPAAPGGD